MIVNNTDGDFPLPMEVKGTASDPLVDVVIDDNIFYNWGGSVRLDGDATTVPAVLLTRNHIQSHDSDTVIVHTDMPTTFTTGHNRFWNAAAADDLIRMDGSNVDLETWRAQVGDVGSTREQVSYPDPSRSVARYNAEVLGGPESFEAFMDEARLQSKDNWRTEYTAAAVNDWIRAGFGVQLSLFADGFESGNTSAWSSVTP